MNKPNLRALALQIIPEAGPEGVPQNPRNVRNMFEIENVAVNNLQINVGNHHILHQKYNKSFIILKNYCTNYTFTSRFGPV